MLFDFTAARVSSGKSTRYTCNAPTWSRRQAGDPRAELPRPGFVRPGAPALTAAELCLLPMLSTHLSFPEIAAEMFLSRSTIKSEGGRDLPQAEGLLTQSSGLNGRGTSALLDRRGAGLPFSPIGGMPLPATRWIVKIRTGSTARR